MIKNLGLYITIGFCLTACSAEEGQNPQVRNKDSITLNRLKSSWSKSWQGLIMQSVAEGKEDEIGFLVTSYIQNIGTAASYEFYGGNIVVEDYEWKYINWLHKKDHLSSTNEEDPLLLMRYFKSPTDVFKDKDVDQRLFKNVDEYRKFTVWFKKQYSEFK